jgi:hypothetical protein
MKRSGNYDPYYSPYVKKTSTNPYISVRTVDDIKQVSGAGGYNPNAIDLIASTLGDEEFINRLRSGQSLELIYETVKNGLCVGNQLAICDITPLMTSDILHTSVVLDNILRVSDFEALYTIYMSSDSRMRAQFNGQYVLEMLVKRFKIKRKCSTFARLITEHDKIHASYRCPFGYNKLLKLAVNDNSVEFFDYAINEGGVILDAAILAKIASSTSDSFYSDVTTTHSEQIAAVIDETQIDDGVDLVNDYIVPGRAKYHLKIQLKRIMPTLTVNDLRTDQYSSSLANAAKVWIKAASKYGRLDIFRFIDENYVVDGETMSKCAIIASKYNHDELVESISDPEFDLSIHILIGKIRGNDLRHVKLAAQQVQSKYDDPEYYSREIMDEAIKIGNMDIIQHLFTIGVVFEPESFVQASLHGHRDVVLYISKQYMRAQ